MEIADRDHRLGITTQNPQMEIADSDEGIGREMTHWWWGIGSAAQLGVGIRATRRGYAGNGNLMPLKALGVASLFVGAIAAASMGTLRACGINKVEDMKELGENIRTSIGAPPRNNTP